MYAFFSLIEEFAKDAGETTLIANSRLALLPWLSLTETFNAYSPTAEYACEAVFVPAFSAAEPSPKLHSYSTIVEFLTGEAYATKSAGTAAGTIEGEIEFILGIKTIVMFRLIISALPSIMRSV